MCQQITIALGIILFSLLSSPTPLYAKKLGLFDRLLGKTEEQTDQETVIDPVPYNVSFSIKNGTRNLEKQLKRISLLVTDKAKPPSGTFGLLRRVSDDQDRLTKVLEALGYYNGRVQILIANQDVHKGEVISRLEQLHSRKKEIPVTIMIDAGDLFAISSVQIKILDKKSSFIEPTLDELKIPLASPAKSTTVLSSEKELLSQARNQGFAYAKITNRDVTVDHKTKTMQVIISLHLGEKAYFGETQISGGESLPGFVAKRIPWHKGDTFSPQKEEQFRKSLQKYDVFQSIRVREDLSQKSTGEVPITVEVQERLPHFIGFGTKFSTTEGITTNAYWGHRNLFGGAERLRLEAQTFGASIDKDKFPEKVSTRDLIGYRVAASLTIPDIFSIHDDLTIIPSASKEVTQYYTREGLFASASYKYHISDYFRIEGGLDYEYAKITRFYDPSFSNDEWYTLFGIPLSFSYDTTSSILDPREGFRLTGTFEPFVSITGSSSNAFLLKGSASVYVPLDDGKRFVLAGRVQVSSISGTDLSDIPPPRRFFAGGGGSVRGYDYRSLGPKNPAGWVIGGSSSLETSAELRMQVTPKFSVVTFMDAGNAFAKNYPDFSENLRYSAGVGIRYHTAIGPLRLDIARGLDLELGDPKFGLYISIGQAF